MSEFVDFPDNEIRPLGEVLDDLYERTRDFIGGLAAGAGIAYQEQQSSSGQSSQEQPKPAHGPGSSCAATACSACGRGGQQSGWRQRQVH